MRNQQSIVRYVVPPLLLFCGGFLFTALWSTLMADVRVLGYSADAIPESILSSTVGFYQTVLSPLSSSLLKVIMLVTLVSISLQLTISAISRYIRFAAFILNAPPILLALYSIVPKGMQFSKGLDSLEVQAQLLHDLYTGHIISIVCISLFCILQLIANIQLQMQGAKSIR